MGGHPSKDNEALTDLLVKRESITKPEVELAFRLADRGRFLPPENRAEAYRQSPIKITSSDASGLFFPGPLHLSAPEIYAIVLCELDLREGMSFLNIGSGSGWLNTAAGFLIGEKGINIGVENFANIVKYAEKKTLETISLPQVHAFSWCRPKYHCCNALTPEFLDNEDELEYYDRIYCGAALSNPRHIDKLLRKLKIGGKLVVPIDPELQRYTRLSPTRCIRTTLSRTTFAPLAAPIDSYVNQSLPSAAKQFPTLKSLCRVAIRGQIRANINANGCEPQMRKVYKEEGAESDTNEEGPSTSMSLRRRQAAMDVAPYELFQGERNIAHFEHHMMHFRRMHDGNGGEEELLDRLHQRVANIIAPMEGGRERVAMSDEERDRRRIITMFETDRRNAARERLERERFDENGDLSELLEIIVDPEERRRPYILQRIVDDSDSDDTSSGNEELEDDNHHEMLRRDRAALAESYRRVQISGERMRQLAERRVRPLQLDRDVPREPYMIYVLNEQGRVPRVARPDMMLPRRSNRLTEANRRARNAERDVEGDDEDEQVRRRRLPNRRRERDGWALYTNIRDHIAFTHRERYRQVGDHMEVPRVRRDWVFDLLSEEDGRPEATISVTQDDVPESSSSSSSDAVPDIPLMPVQNAEDPREKQNAQRLDRKRKHEMKKEERVKRQRLQSDEFNRFQELFNSSIDSLNVTKNLQNYVRDLLHYCV